MNHEDDGTIVYQLELNPEDVNLLYHCVCKRLENWEGSPARPAEEQEHLWSMKHGLYRVVLDHKFHEM